MKKIGVGIIGLGNISDFHAEGYISHPNSLIAAVADINEERVRGKAKSFGAKNYYNDYRALLRDEAVEAVDICTPHCLHAEMAVAAAEAGKHIYVEKPMAISVDECDQMISAARKAGVKLMVGFNQLFYPPYQRAKELIDRGEIGKPLILRARLGMGLTKLKETGGWRLDPKISGGGVLMDPAHHRLYVSRYLMGEVDTVWAVIDHIEPGLLTEDLAIVILKFVNGSYGVFDINCHNPSTPLSWDDRTEISGTEGIIFLGGCERAINLVKGPLPFIPLSMYKSGKLTIIEDAEADWPKTFMHATHHFIDCIIGDKAPMTTGEDGRRIIQIVQASYKSAKEGKPVSI